MNVEIRQVEPMRLAAARHRGPYWEIGQTFAKLGHWLEQAGVPLRQMIAVYYDDPSQVAPQELQSDAGTAIEPETIVIHEHLHVVEIEGGEYAVATHFGPYSGLGDAWGWFHGEWLPSSGRRQSSAPTFEVYVRMCGQVSEAEAQTDLYIKLEPAP
jgi:AraC family transcriptional regulator